MASVVRRQNFEVPVDFYGFALQEYDDMQVPVAFPEDRGESGRRPFLTPYEMRLDVDSAGHTHRAALVAEVWDAEPPPEEAGAWEACGDAEIFSPTGQLSIEVIAGAVPDTVELGVPDRLWKVRVGSAGRAEVARLAHLGVPHGVERYRIRFWPAARP